MLQTRCLYVRDVPVRLGPYVEQEVSVPGYDIYKAVDQFFLGQEITLRFEPVVAKPEPHSPGDFALLHIRRVKGEVIEVVHQGVVDGAFDRSKGRDRTGSPVDEDTELRLIEDVNSSCEPSFASIRIDRKYIAV